VAPFPKWNALLLLFLHHVTAHTLPFKVRCRHRLQHVAHISAPWKAQTLIMHFFFKEVNKNISRYFLDLLLQFMKYCSGSVDFHCCLTPQTEITQDMFCWSFMLHPLNRRMVVKPHMSGKCKMLWCSVLHEMQFGIIVPLSNSGQTHSYEAYSDSIHHPFCFVFSL